jgi:hypothetical protein
VVTRNTDGQPHSTMGRIPYYVFQEPGRVCERSDDPLAIVRMREASGRLRDDLRTLGAAAFPSRFDLQDTIWFDNVHTPVAPRVERTQDGDLECVRVTMSACKRTYWLDPQKAWSPVRVREEDERKGAPGASPAQKLC